MELPVGEKIAISKKDLRIKLAQAALLGSVIEQKKNNSSLIAADLQNKAYMIADGMMKQIEIQGITK